jgi:hypothetical protein
LAKEIRELPQGPNQLRRASELGDLSTEFLAMLERAGLP